MDPDHHWLLHKMDRGHPHKASHRNSNHAIFGRTYPIYIHRKIITDNSLDFKSKKMIAFYFKYQIQLGHSTSYYPQGNGLVESSNKRLMRIIKKILQENNKDWHTKLIHAVWADRISIKKSIGTFPLHILYVSEVIFPNSLSLPVMILLQEEDA